MAHETTLDASRHTLQMINHAIDLGLSTATIGPLTTVAGLRSAIGSLSVHEAYLDLIRQIQKAVDTAEAMSILNNTNVAAADTIAGLRAIFTTFNSALTATDTRSFQWT
jgi:hypothetical protein